MFADGVFEIIVNEDFTVFSIILDKERHWNQYVTPANPYSLTLEMIMERYQHYLERTGSIGMVVAHANHIIELRKSEDKAMDGMRARAIDQSVLRYLNTGNTTLLVSAPLLLR